MTGECETDVHVYVVLMRACEACEQVSPMQLGAYDQTVRNSCTPLVGRSKDVCMSMNTMSEPRAVT